MGLGKLQVPKENTSYINAQPTDPQAPSPRPSDPQEQIWVRDSVLINLLRLPTHTYNLSIQEA